jgi:hypothetical protein
MKNLFEYVNEVKKEYQWKLKFIVPVTAEMVDKIESLLAKFDVKKVSQPKKTILQGRPLDFADAGPSEVYMMDVVCEMPGTREAIREVLASGLKLNLSQVVVRSPNEPLETDREQAEPKDDAKPLLGSDYEKTEDPKKVYGDEYNQKMVKDYKSPFSFEVAGKEKTTKDPGPAYTSGNFSPLGSKKPQRKG